MKDYQTDNSIRDIVLARIKQGGTQMKPKWYFRLKAMFFGVATLSVFVLLVFFTSLAIFILRKSGVVFTPFFGLQGIKVFLVSLPWILLVLLLILMAVFETMIRHYSFTYRRPVFYSLVIIAVLMLLGGVVAFKVRVHESFLKYADDRDILPMKSIYHDYALQRIDNVHVGDIREVLEDSFVIGDMHGEVMSVSIYEDTELPENNDLEVGDNIVVMGELRDGNINALGVKRINPRVIEKIIKIENKKKHPNIRQRIKKVFNQ
jgi:hypothetical protein